LKKNLALAAIALVFLLSAAQAQSPNSSIQDQLKTIQAGISDLKAQNDSLAAQVASIANKGPRRFYLTKTQYSGAQALSACAAGYHMASLWEIHDPTNLRYDTVLGFTTDDSGSGPPSASTPGGFGWIRTGKNKFTVNLIGVGNCNAWMSASATEFGTAVSLAPGWGSNGQIVEPWEAIAFTCNVPQHVWCVQD